MTISDGTTDRGSNMNDMICYCYKYTEEDIKADYLKAGRSRIFEKIKSEKRAGNCTCATLHPAGK